MILQQGSAGTGEAAGAEIGNERLERSAIGDVIAELGFGGQAYSMPQPIRAQTRAAAASTTASSTDWLRISDTAWSSS